MAQNYIEPGDVFEYTVPASTTIASGEGVIMGDAFGVALRGGTTGAVLPVKVTGVFTLPKATGTAISYGAKVYWDATNKRITATDASGVNKLAGYAFGAELSAATTVKVKLAL